MSGIAPASPFNVLFLCTANSARSIMAEAIANRLGRGRLRAFSAGSRPARRVQPAVIALLIDLGYETAHLHSKGIAVFSGPHAPVMDGVITVCDNAAGEACPVWPGHPASAHWSIPDPAGATPRAYRASLVRAYGMLERRIAALAELPLATLAAAERQRHLQAIAEFGIPPAFGGHF